MVKITLDGVVHNFFRYGIDVPNSLIFQCSEGFTHPLHWFSKLNPKLEFRLEKQLQLTNNTESCFNAQREWIAIIYPTCNCCGNKKNPDRLGWTTRISDTEYLFVFDESKTPTEWLDKIYGNSIIKLFNHSLDYTARKLAHNLLDYPDHYLLFKVSVRDGSPEKPSNKLYTIECDNIGIIDVHPITNTTILSGRITHV